MSSIVEVYAKDLGVKIGKPTITEHFFPNTIDKYICCDFDSDNKSESYNYWDIVRSLIKPFLNERDISLIKIPDILDKQKNFFIKNSLLYIGLANHNTIIADYYKIPSVSLLTNIYENNFNPLFIGKIITPNFSDLKPSFNQDCHRINEIKPEVIAQSILDQLGIQEKIKFKTIRIGKTFHNDVVEIVPNFAGISEQLKDKPINIRGDIHSNLKNIVTWCQYSYVNLYINSSFDIELLQHMTKLKQIIFKYQESENSDQSKFFKELKRRKVNLIIQAQKGLDVNEVRLKYFDYNVIEEAEEPMEEIKASKFLSKKRFAVDGKSFKSESSAKRLDNSDNFIYDEISSKELESLYLYEEE